MPLGRVLDKFKELEIELRPQGFFNVENGRFSIANRFHAYCDCYVETLGQSSCDICTRGNELSFLTFPSGDGDGIYMVYSIVGLAQEPGESELKLGFIALFDYQYQIASHGRKALASGELPEFPVSLARQFEDCLALEIGSINVDRTLLIGNGPFSLNSHDAVVDIPGVAGGNYICVAYCEPIDATVEGVAKRLSQTQGSTEEEFARLARIVAKTFAEMAKSEDGVDPTSNPFPPFVPRAVIALHSELRAALEPQTGTTIDEIHDLDWKLLKAQFSYGSVVLAHKQSMVNSVIWQNVLLANQYDLDAGEVSDAAAKRLVFDVKTWLYQGRELGDEQCINALVGYTYTPTPEEEIYLYMRRGMQSTAAKYLK